MRTHLLYKALWKPQLAAGIELVPFIIIFVFSLVVFLISINFYIKLSGIIFGGLIYSICKYINSKEPYAFEIFFRYAKFQKFYLNIGKYSSRSTLIKNFSRR